MNKSSQLNLYAHNLVYGIAIACLLLITNNLQANNAEYDIKAAYIFQFTKYTQWPDELFNNENDPLRICVQGKNPFSKSFNNITSKTSQGRNVVLEYIDELNQISGCHIVYISDSESKRLEQILKITKDLPILTVSDIKDFAQRGGIIGMVVEKRKIRIRINYDSSKQASLKISSKLLGVATLVKKSEA